MWSRALTLVVCYKTEKNSYHECMMHDGLQRLFVRMHNKIGYYIIILLSMSQPFSPSGVHQQQVIKDKKRNNKSSNLRS